MDNFEFQLEPVFLFILPLFYLLGWLLLKWAKKYPKPTLYFPDLLALQNTHNVSIKQKYAYLPTYCLWTSFVAFSLALLNPHFFTLKSELQEQTSSAKEGIAIYLIVDESGSMMEEVNAKSAKGIYEKMTKIALLKQLTVPFITSRPNDLIGLIAFARTADIRTPLTLDHQAVIDELQLLNPSIDDKQGGTAIGYALFKTVNLIIATKHFAKDLINKGEPAYEIKNAIILLVTDGVQNVNPQDVNNKFRSMDVSEAAKYAKENHIRFYAINVDPSILTERFTPERNLMRRVTELTGGHFYVVDNSNSLSQIFNDINNIEKSEFKEVPLPKGQLPDLYNRFSFFPFLIAVGLLFLILFVILESTLFKRVP